MFAPITAKIITDSINPLGYRLTTWELTYPRFIHAELMTHRVLSRNSASSRAIPTAKLRQRVIDGPAGHEFWGANQKGMQASEEVFDTTTAAGWWHATGRSAIGFHETGEKLGLHKQIVNRIIEPWMMITVIVSATEWANFFHQRNHPDAEPNFQKLASTMWDLYTTSMPVRRSVGEWHRPYVDHQDVADAQALANEITIGDTAHTVVSDILNKVSVGRCARVSYLTHDGKRDIREDIALHDKLAGTFRSGSPGHFSPFEHVAYALDVGLPVGNFRGWRQYRKLFEHEAGPDRRMGCSACGMWSSAGHVKGCPRVGS